MFIPVVHLAGDTVKVAIGSAHAESDALSAASYLATASSACHIAVGADPTATINMTLIPANVPLILRLNDSDKVSVIRDSADGTLFLTPVTE